MAQELGEVKPIRRVLLEDYQIGTESQVSLLAYPDDCKNYRYWGFNLVYARAFEIGQENTDCDIEVYHGDDAVGWDLLETFQLTNSLTGFQFTFRVQRRYYGLIAANPSDTHIINVTLMTRKGN